MKLELKYLSAYLPYGLKFALTMSNDQFTCVGLTVEVDGIMAHYNGGSANVSLFKYYKPVLRPMSDLLTIHKGSATFIDVIEFECNGYQIGRIVSNLNPDYLPYEVVKKLIEYHFDVFGLIDAGLAININDLNQKK